MNEANFISDTYQRWGKFRYLIIIVVVSENTNCMSTAYGKGRQPRKLNKANFSKTK